MSAISKGGYLPSRGMLIKNDENNSIILIDAETK